MKNTIWGIIAIFSLSIFFWLYYQESIGSIFVSMVPFLLCVLVDYRTRSKLSKDEDKYLNKKKSGFLTHFLIIFLGSAGISMLLTLLEVRAIKGINYSLIGFFCIGLGYLGLVLWISVAFKKIE